MLERSTVSAFTSFDKEYRLKPSHPVTTPALARPVRWRFAAYPKPILLGRSKKVKEARERVTERIKIYVKKRENAGDEEIRRLLPIKHYSTVAQW
ncbi:hypothetical protein MM221_12285 [Salipaludibacillus sp. LMS25]|uniref:hypothetical protein n=1 Tax=Salipaludibacillus sp. LMS25 TaxID=2924031 RepID=UPI0020D1E673|nr:hypothetical protein [Salipaludibacillus sp. LMS25]UTR13419.1 hypothetical protein MM221_12285 [Salipaludibacillus sp. LMS25]